MSESLKIKDYLLCMQQIPALSDGDLKQALLDRARGDEWARRLLEERYLPRVLGWILPYRGHGLEFSDLIEVGNRALLRGLRQLKPGNFVDATDSLEQCVIEEVEAAVFTRSAVKD